ncbi:uncharacterized protein LOC107431876 [Ziziphus jujuba]|uniref:Uncharacterized protein LOC107431876 n=2 Tax=Ziziphus jujuba TaxID=326968 RepID=A0A6P4AKM4_ZIZJJ|nr:uncharacterized protein LOC107431876 [Ziziphus jujuba]KAH7511980.1 hypothetical protein FEM48_Zijuj12G0041600 [Ziziphus jujuba var. spinosa]
MAASIIKLWITGSKIPFEVDAIGPMTFQQVKEKIRNAVNVEPERQNLYYNEVKMQDEHQVRQCVLDFFGYIELRVTPLPENAKVTVLCKARNRDVEAISIRETDTVESLRSKLSMTWGIPMEKIVLHRCGSHMEDDFPLSDYYVCEGAQVNVSITPSSPR